MSSFFPMVAFAHAFETVRTTSVAGGDEGGTLSGRISRQIRAALFADRLSPGERLGTEASLARQFGVSRTAVRDALRSLAAWGIIEIKVGQRGGVFVAQSRPEHVAEMLAIQWKLNGAGLEDVLDAQIAVEVTAAGLAARAATGADISRLKAEIDAMERDVDAPDAFTRASLGFHEMLVIASNNRILIAQFKALRYLLTPVYARRTTGVVARRAVASHRALVACIEARDPVATSDLLRRRLEVVRARHLLHDGARDID